MDPLAFNAFFPAHVTDTAGTDPEVTALLDAPALPEVIGPPECIAPEVIALLADALGALLGAAALEALLGEALLLLPHAASNATHTVMTPAAMLVLFRLTWFSSEEIS